MRRFDILVEKRNGELEDILKKTLLENNFPIGN